MAIDQVSFWNERASLGEYAGTRDRILKRLEIEAIAKYVKDGMRVLDAGCGDGETALELRRRFQIGIDAIDQAGEMVKGAEMRRVALFMNRVYFHEAAIADWHPDYGYDLIFSERTIINLPDWDTQLKAIQHLISLLKPGGIYVMCESCQDGLDRINSLRAVVDLPAIVPPEHNRYLRNQEIGEARSAGLLPSFGQDDFTSTYYLLSRVVNAAMAEEASCEPNYESPINKLGLELPPLVYGLGQTRIWTFRREG